MKQLMKIGKKKASGLFLVFFCLLMVVSGLWRFSSNMLLGVLISLLLSLLVFDEIKTSKNIRNYFFLLIIMTIGLFTYKGSLVEVDKTLLFGAGGLFMLLSYNVSIVSDGAWVKKLVNLLLWVGVFYAVVFILKEMGLESVRGFHGEMVKWIVGGRNHHHIGDYWVIPMLVVIWEYLSSRKLTKKIVLLFLVGAVILWISKSRSAYFSLFISGMYLLSSARSKKKSRKIKNVLMWSVLVLVMVSGFSKPIISSRPYWVQGIYGLRDFPLGVGFGNFGKLSNDVSNHLFSLSSYSSVTHSLPLEYVVGYGILGLVFIYWYLVVIKKAFPSSGFVLEKSIVLALSVNFLTDYTYFIPSMIWVWFVLVGAIEGYSKK